MKKFHYIRGVRRRTRLSFVVVAVLLFAELFSLQHYAFLNLQVSAEGIDTAYLEKLQSERNKEEVVTSKILFMGDVMLARSIGSSIVAGDNPFKFVQPVLDQHDVQVANIETTIADASFAQSAAKPYTFNAPLESLSTLKNAGIDVSSLANNHTGDFGREATANTIDQLANAGLVSVGAGKNSAEAFAPKLVESNGINIAFIAVNDIELAHTKVSDTVAAGSAYFDKELLGESIRNARVLGADFVVVMPHWGIEYSLTASARQQEWGRFMIDEGADLVVGSHPHVVQPTEEYKGKQIVYSLGNFIFDGMSGEALKGQMVSVELQKSTTGRASKREMSTTKAISFSSIPIQIDAQGYPSL